MAIKVIRICDECGAEYEQIIDACIKEIDSYPIAFMCSSCILRLAYADELDALQAEQNDNRGISCVKSIVFQMRKNDMLSAKRVYQSEGDKISQYPGICEWLENHFGCRTHLKIDCDNWLCKRTQ